MSRAVLWLVAGLALAVAAMVATVPGALGNLRAVGSLMALVMAAGVPGLVLLLMLVVRRRRDRDGAAEAAARAQPERITPIATSPEWDRRHDGDA